MIRRSRYPRRHWVNFLRYLGRSAPIIRTIMVIPAIASQDFHMKVLRTVGRISKRADIAGHKPEPAEVDCPRPDILRPGREKRSKEVGQEIGSFNETRRAIPCLAGHDESKEGESVCESERVSRRGAICMSGMHRAARAI